MSSISSTSIGLGDRIHAYSLRFSWLQNMSRLHAFAGHLLTSLLVVSLVFGIVFYAWYPNPFFDAVGAWSVIRILVGVDLVLGPLLTLIVFKPAKRLLIVDVVFIALVQLSALTYGITVLYQERPQFTVFALDRFHVLSEQDVPDQARAEFDWIRKPANGPLMASARLPTTVAEQQRLMDETVFGGAPDIEQRPSLWVPYEQDAVAAGRDAYPLDLLRISNSASEQVDRILIKLGVSESELGFYPMLTAKNEVCAIVHRDSGALAAVIDIDPWEIIR